MTIQEIAKCYSSTHYHVHPNAIKPRIRETLKWLAAYGEKLKEGTGGSEDVKI
jgi:hypothetical protein